MLNGLFVSTDHQCDIIYTFQHLNSIYCIMRKIIVLGSSLPPVVCRRAHVLLMLFLRVNYSGVKHVLTVYMSNMVVSYKR